MSCSILYVHSDIDFLHKQGSPERKTLYMTEIGDGRMGEDDCMMTVVSRLAMDQTGLQLLEKYRVQVRMASGQI